MKNYNHVTTLENNSSLEKMVQTEFSQIGEITFPQSIILNYRL